MKMRTYNRYPSGLGYRLEKKSMKDKLKFIDKYPSLYRYKLCIQLYKRLLAGK